MRNDRLYRLREDAGLSQSELAIKIGVSQSMIARIEAGKRDPRTETKVSLARFFKVSVEWLFYEQIYDQRLSTCPLTGTDS